MTDAYDPPQSETNPTASAHGLAGGVAALLEGPGPGGVVPGSVRRRGRPPEMTRGQVIEQVRALGGSGALFRVHRTLPALYARARRLFGSWASALDAAGLDYRSTLEEARRRSVTGRQAVQAGRRTAPRSPTGG